MSENLQLIWKKIEHLRRMRSYLDYSLEQTLPLMPSNVGKLSANCAMRLIMSMKKTNYVYPNFFWH